MMPIATAKMPIISSRVVAVKSASSSAMSRRGESVLTMYGIPYNYDSRDMRHNATRRARRSAASSDVRATLDAFRRIVQALRMEGASNRRSRHGLSSAQIFALQRIAEHPSASINDIAALTFTH